MSEPIDGLAGLNELMDYVQARRAEYAEIAASSKKRGLEVKKLAAECRELGYFDVMKAIERIQAGQKAGQKA